MSKESRQKLYQALSGQFDLGAYEEFDSKMNNPESRQKLYNAVSQSFDLGSYEEFESKIGGTAIGSTTQVQKKKDGSVESTPISPQKKQPLPKLPEMGIGGFEQEIKPTTIEKPSQQEIKQAFKPIPKEKTQQAEYEFARRQNIINDDFLKQKEEQVVPQLNRAFGEYNFQFEETGFGNQVLATAPNGSQIKIKANSWTDKERDAEKKKLEDFIQANKPGERILLEAQPDKIVKDFDKEFAMGVKLPKIGEEIGKVQKEVKILGMLERGYASDIGNRTDILVQNYQDGKITKEQAESGIKDIQSEIERVSKKLQQRGNTLQEKEKGFAGEKEALVSAVERYLEDKKLETNLRQTMLRKFESGLDNVSAGIWRTPEFLYDLGVQGYNILAEGIESVTGIEQARVSTSSEIADRFGISNVNAEILEARQNELSKIETKYDGSITDFIAKGEYALAAQATAASITESIPFTLAVMIPSAAGVSTLGTFGATTAVMGAGRYQELEGEDYTQGQKLNNALMYGMSEAMETLLGAGSLGRNLKKIAQKEGISKAKQYAAKTIDVLIDENKWLAPAKEGLQEVATTLMQNISDNLILGEDKPIWEGTGDAMLVGMVMGAGFTTVQAAAEQLSKYSENKKNEKFYNTISNLATNGDLYQKTFDDIKSRIASMNITEEQGNEMLNNLSQSVGAYRSIPSELSDKQKKEAFVLLQEKRALEAYIQDKDPALVEAQKIRLNEINEKLKQISINQGGQDAVQISETTEVPLEEQPRIGEGVGTEVSEQAEIGAEGEEATTPEEEVLEKENVLYTAADGTQISVEEVAAIDDGDLDVLKVQKAFKIGFMGANKVLEQYEAQKPKEAAETKEEVKVETEPKVVENPKGISQLIKEDSATQSLESKLSELEKERTNDLISNNGRLADRLKDEIDEVKRRIYKRRTQLEYLRNNTLESQLEDGTLLEKINNGEISAEDARGLLIESGIKIPKEIQDIADQNRKAKLENKESIITRTTDFLGDEKEAYMVDNSKENGIFTEDDVEYFKAVVQRAISSGMYEKAIAEGRMTAKDAKFIIESYGLKAPKSIKSLLSEQQAEPKAEEKEVVGQAEVNNNRVVVHNTDGGSNLSDGKNAKNKGAGSISDFRTKEYYEVFNNSKNHGKPIIYESIIKGKTYLNALIHNPQDKYQGSERHGSVLVSIEKTNDLPNNINEILTQRVISEYNKKQQQRPEVFKPISEQQAEPKAETPALKDVESTAKALEGNSKAIEDIQVKTGRLLPTAKLLSEAYHKAKKDGSNPELVAAVESLLSEQQAEQQVEPKEESTTKGKEKSIFNQDTDLLGDEKLEEYMTPIEYSEREPKVGDSVEVKGESYESTNFRGFDDKGNAIIDVSENKDGSKRRYTINRSKDKIVNPKTATKGSPGQIEYALDEGLYEEWVKEGRMSAQDAKIIIESLGYRSVPESIKQQAEQQSKEQTNEKAEQVAPKQEVLAGVSETGDKNKGRKEGEQLREKEVVGEIPFNNWRISIPSKFGGTKKILHNKVGVKLSQNEADIIIEGLKKFAETKGESVNAIYDKEKGHIRLGINDELLQDYFEQQGAESIRTKKIEAEKKAQEDKKAEREKGVKEELSENSDVVNWINSIFGEGVMNDFNTKSLVDFITGKEKEFRGLVNPKWKSGLEKINAIKDGNVDFGKIKTAFAESKSKQQSAPSLSVEEKGIATELSQELDVPKSEIAKTKKNNEKTTRKSTNITRAVKSEAKTVEANGNVERAAEIVETIEATTDAILNNHTESDVFESTYGVNPIDVANNYNEMDKKNADILSAFASVKGVEIMSVSEFQDQFGDYNDFLKEFLKAVSGMKLKHIVEVKGTVEVKVGPKPKKIKQQPTPTNLKSIVIKDPMKPNLEGVYYEDGNAIATDANKLVVIKNKTAEADIINDAIDAHYKVMKKSNPSYSRKQAEEYVKGKLKDGKIEGSIINPNTGDVVDAKYPNYKGIIPSHESKVEGIDANELFAEVNGAELASKNAVLGYYKINTEKGVISFQPKLIREALEALIANGAKTITLEYGDANRPIVLRAENGDYALVMPIMVKEDSNGVAVNSEVIKAVEGEELSQDVTPKSDAKEQVGGPLESVESTAKALEGIGKDKLEKKSGIDETPTARGVDYGGITWQQSGLSSFNKGSDGKTYITSKDNKIYQISKTKVNANNTLLISIKDTKGNEVGFFEFKKNKDESFSAEESYVSEKRKGLATIAYDFASQEGIIIKPSKKLKIDGIKFWSNSTSKAYHAAKKDGSNPELVKAVEGLLVGKQELSGSAKAKAELEAAKKAFDNKIKGGLQFGGLGALPEFIKLVKAYAKVGIANAADFIAQFRNDFPNEVITDENLEIGFNEIQTMLENQAKIEQALNDKKAEITKLKAKVRALASSRQNAKDKAAELKRLRNELADFINNNMPKKDLITRSIAAAIAKVSTEKQLDKVVDRLINLIGKNIAAVQKAERDKLINRIQDSLSTERLIRKGANDKLGRPVIDKQAMDEIKSIMSQVTTPLDQMTNQQLSDLADMIDTAFQEGKVRQSDFEKVLRAERKAKSLRLSQSIAEKKKLFKPLTTVDSAIASLERGNFVLFNGVMYDKSTMEDFLAAVGVDLPTTTIGNNVYKVRETSPGKYIVKTIDSSGNLINVSLSSTEAQSAIAQYKVEKAAKLAQGITAQQVPVTKQSGNVSRIVAGIWARAVAWKDMIYDLSGKSYSRQLEKDLYDPAAKATMEASEQKIRYQKIHKKEKARIFGSVRKGNKKLRAIAGISIADVDGKAIKDFRNDEAIYLYNVLQRSDMSAKFLKSKFSQETIDKIYDYVLSDPQLTEYAQSLIKQYSDYLPEINAALVANGYAPIEAKRVPSKEQLEKAYGAEYADKYYERLAKANGGIVPMFEPYSPASVSGAEMGTLQDTDLLGGNYDVTSVISNNAMATTRGGDLQVKSAEQMFGQWLDGMTNMEAKLDLFKTFQTTFNKANMLLIGDTYGKQYERALREMITSILLGKSRYNADSYRNTWLNRGSAVTMFVNVSSAIYQKVSFLNYAFADGVFVDYAANWGKYMWSKEYRDARKKITNALWVRARIEGDLSSAELREISDNDTKYNRWLDQVLSGGYGITRFMDANAIISGGTPYYMSMNKRLFEQYSKIMPKSEAKAKAEEDAMFMLYKRTQESQQSSEQYEMSIEQKNPLARQILTFGSVGLQYTRLAIRAARDIKNGRGNTLENIAKIVYFVGVQNLLFNFASKALSAVIASGDDEEDEKIKQGIAKSVNATIDGALRGLGVLGAVTSVTKNLLYDYMAYVAINDEKAKLSEAKQFAKDYKASLKEKGDTEKAEKVDLSGELYTTKNEMIDWLVEMGDSRERLEKLSGIRVAEETMRALSPNIGSKFTGLVRMLSSANKEDFLRSGATGLQIATNIPTGRLVDIGEQVIDATAEDLTTMERALRLANILKKYDIEQRRNKKIKEEIEAQKTYDRIQKEKESAAKKAEKDYQRMMRENFPDMYKEMRELDPNIQMKKELNKLKKNME